MSRLRNSLLAVAAALLIAQALLFTSPGRALAKEVTDVFITNTAANPVFVRSIDDGRQPFSLFDAVGIDDGQSFANRSIFTVPVGKRLIIESVSARIGLPHGQSPSYLSLRTKAGGTSTSHTIAMIRQGTSNILQQDEYASTYALRLYADPESQILIGAARSDSTGIAIAYFSLSGYYIDVP